MKTFFAFIATFLIIAVFANSMLACGPGYISPVYEFDSTPEVPFENFVGGKIGIVKPNFGRKSLFVAYRQIVGASFSFDEQKQLVEALKGVSSETDEQQTFVVKNWVSARKQVLSDETKLPEIYVTRQVYDSYSFFPNCAKNAFEVATETLNDRVSSYGATDSNVKNWLAAQDAVFSNCDGGAEFPAESGAESPAWLQKDRKYQIAAANFYALKFDEAKRRFQEIADDDDSPWQNSADYLIARTLIRQASLSGDDETAKRDELYRQAEVQLLKVRSQKYYDSAQKFGNLIKYRIHPQERLRELGQKLAYGGNDNLRQDLIDYNWLLDKFEAQTRKEIDARKNPEVPKDDAATNNPPSKEAIDYEKAQKGEIIPIVFRQKKADGEIDYSTSVDLSFKPDANESEIFSAFEQKLNRKLTDDEKQTLRDSQKNALEQRVYYLSPNRKFETSKDKEYEGDYYSSADLKLNELPDFMRGDDLSDWIFTFSRDDAESYVYAAKKWRETNSPLWLMTAIVKAKIDSPKVAEIMKVAANANHDAPAFPTIAESLARLYIETGKTAEARKLLDEMLIDKANSLPASAKNHFAAQRLKVAENLDEFLRYAQRKPFVYDYDGVYQTAEEIIAEQKTNYNAETEKRPREDYEREIEANNKDLLLWQHQSSFDEDATDVFNKHFPLTKLIETAKNSILPDYLQRKLIIAAWTRAVLLGKEDVVAQTAPEVVKSAPELGEIFETYFKAQTAQEKKDAELWIMIKNKTLTPFVTSGVSQSEINAWQEGWWIEPNPTYYENGEEKPKSLSKPSFIIQAESDAATLETKQIVALGSVKSDESYGNNAENYLSNRVFEFVRRNPKDERAPEMLFIVAVINEQEPYSNGNETYLKKAQTLLKTRYASSSWATKLETEDK